MIENKEQYKKEYNDFFKYTFQKYTLAFSKPVLEESYHVAEGMEDAATEIGNIVKKFITEIIENGPLDMYQHNLIKMPGNKTYKSIIRKYLSDADRLKRIIDFGHIAANVPPIMNFVTETIFLSIKKHFSHYLSNVHVIIAQKFPHLYNYKRVVEVFECAGSLYSDEVILYPVV